MQAFYESIKHMINHNAKFYSASKIKHLLEKAVSWELSPLAFLSALTHCIKSLALKLLIIILISS